MRKPNTAKAAPQITEKLRHRAALARDAAGRFMRRSATAHASSTPSDLANACDQAIAGWNAIQPASQAENWGDVQLDAALDAYDAVVQRAINEPSRDSAEVQAKARLLLHDLIEHTTGHDPSDETTLTADERLTRVVLREVAALSPSGEAVDWFDPPPGFMASPAIDPMNFARIPQGIAIELNRLRSIAMAEFNRRVGPETSAGDIARISLELRLDVLANAAHLDDSIPGQVEVASASLLELRVIREKMALLSDVAYGVAAQDCCKAEAGDPAASRYNAAGTLMHWLADEFTTVEDRAGAELQRRQPTDFWGRRTRLANVAERVIMNGDDAETASLIQDLTAFAAEQAEH